MLTLRRSEERGHASHGWLETWHTFSFADYFDPDFLGFGPLRVINQDVVRPGRGFPPHGHHDMEIVTYVLDGVLEHQDSMGNGSRIRPGEVQLLSAGTGVTHSERNPSEDEDVHLLQMWVLPAARGRRPRYEQRELHEGARRGRLALAVSPDGRDGSLTIGQDARLLAALVDGQEVVRYDVAKGRSAWLHVARGSLAVNGERLGPGDGAAVRAPTSLRLDAAEGAEVVLWDLPAS